MFQRRRDGSENFYRGWTEYASGELHTIQAVNSCQTMSRVCEWLWKCKGRALVGPEED